MRAGAGGWLCAMCRVPLARCELWAVCGQAESRGGGAEAAAGGEQLGCHRCTEGGVCQREGGAGEAASGVLLLCPLGPSSTSRAFLGVYSPFPVS